ncbi:MAG: ankyrin repeat domain-containing protein [Bacteroidia bacterium]|nr:ankyrin repeat domain-containing protein [Bacteroidia bacterium]
MKFYLLFISFALCGSMLFAQEDEIEAPLEYPFAETGTEVPRGVFGDDDRKEVRDAEGIEDYVRATAVMVPKTAVRGNRVYGQTLRQRLNKIYGDHPFDADVRFLDQPTSAYCTGFLIAPDILVTAGHCIETMEQAKNYYWIFDYTNELKYKKDTWSGYLDVDPNDIYEVAEVLDAYFQDLSTYTDYSVLRLNRKSERAPYRFRTSGEVSTYSKVSTIGSPTGLPLKYADNAKVVDNSPERWFKNDIDGFPGNSGGPVFNPLGFIEGIHVRGAVELQDGKYTGDYKYDYSCNCIKTVKWWSTFGTAGSHAHRITKVPNDLLHRAIYENIEYAIKSRNGDRLKSWLAYSWLLDHDYTNERGRLEWAAINSDNMDALKAIMAKTETVIQDQNGRNLLFYAIDNNNQSFLDYLLEKNISPDQEDNSGVSPLKYAMKRSSQRSIETFLEAGANPYVVDSYGNNLLHWAAENGDVQFIRDLVNLGVNAGSRNYAGKRPEDIAKKAKRKSVRKLLKKARKKKRL